MTFRQALLVLLRQKYLIALAVVLALGATAAYAELRSPSFAATASVTVRPQLDSTTNTQVAPDPELATSDAVATLVARSLASSGKPSAAAARDGSASASLDETTNVVSVTARSSTAAGAVQLANAYIAAYVTTLDNKQEATKTTLAQQADQVNDKISQLSQQLHAQPRSNVLKLELQNTENQAALIQSQQLQAEIAPAPASAVHQATGAAPTGTSALRLLLLAAVVGLLAGSGLALLRHQFDTKVRTTEDAESIARRPVLSSLPYVRELRRAKTDLPVVTTPRSAYAESIRELRTSLMVLLAKRRAPVLIVTSPAPFDGKTLATANLAASCALSGKRTVLVSGDLRRPRIHEFFGVPERVGVAEAIADTGTVLTDLSTYVVDTEIEGLDFVSAGRSAGDPADALAGVAFSGLLDRLRETHDVVIVDTPPVLAVADAAIIGAHANGALVIARSGRTSQRELAETLKRLRAAHVPVLGLALNRVTRSSRPAYGDYYRAARWVDVGSIDEVFGPAEPDDAAAHTVTFTPAASVPPVRAGQQVVITAANGSHAAGVNGSSVATATRSATRRTVNGRPRATRPQPGGEPSADRDARGSRKPGTDTTK